jgi:tetratricopeptide (TPR) repeat protein
MGYKIGAGAMNKQILLVYVLSVYTGVSIAGTVQETFLQANAAYMAGKVQDALKLYQSLEPKGPAVWYNMGNCYYKIGNYPEAIVHWRRAQKHVGWQDVSTLEQCIVQAYQAQGLAYHCPLSLRIHTAIIRCGSLCSLFMLQIIFLCCLWALLLLGLAWFKQSRYFLLIMMSGCTFFVACVNIVAYRFQEYPFGIVTKKVISVYAGPGKDYACLTEAKVLDVVRVYQKRGDWLKVQIDQCGYGWIQAADLVVI